MMYGMSYIFRFFPSSFFFSSRRRHTRCALVMEFRRVLFRSDFDPDDNYACGPEGADIDDEASTEALVWQLLLAINPGDEDAALQQFGAFQEALDGGDAGDVDAVWLLKDVIDWKSGFHIEDRKSTRLNSSH